MARTEGYTEYQEYQEHQGPPPETHQEAQHNKPKRPGKVASLAAGGLLVSSSLAGPLLSQSEQNDPQQINNANNEPPGMASRAFQTAQPLAPYSDIFTSKAYAEGTMGALGALGSAGEAIPTFVDLPPDAQETYPGSHLYKGAISSQMAGAIGEHTQENYDRYQITKESNLGLPLGSIYLTSAEGQHVEMPVYERAAFTAYDNFPTPQILSTMIYEGKMQVSDTEFIQFSDGTKQAFLSLPLAGEGDPSTPKVAQMADLMTSSVDAAWTQANQSLDAQGKLSPFDIKAHFPDMSATQIAQYNLGDKDPATGHKTADIINVGLQKMFGDQVIENAGLAKGPAVWINAKIGGVVTPVLFQQRERMSITVNPNNYETDKYGKNIGTTVDSNMKDESNNTVVQVGLQGQIVYNGLLAVNTVPTPSATPGKTEAPTAVATATPAGNEGLPRVEVPFKYGTLTIEDQDSQLDFQMTNPSLFAQALDKEIENKGTTNQSNKLVVKVLPFGTDLKDANHTYRGLQVFQFDLHYDNNGGAAAAEMAVLGTDGVGYLQVESKEDLEKAMYNNQNPIIGINNGRDYVNAQFAGVVLQATNGKTIPRNIIGNELGDQIFGYKDAQGNEHWEQCPLKVSIKP